MTSHRQLLFATALAAAASLLCACGTSGFPRRFDVGRTPAYSATPPSWRGVRVTHVHGVSRTTLDDITVGEAPAKYLARVLEKRLGGGGTGAAAGATLAIENVRLALSPEDKALGVAADFVLSRNGKTKRISLEHTVAAPMRGAARAALYTRAIVDLTDVLLYHPDALLFLGGSSQRLVDSALRATKGSDVGVGPILRVSGNRRSTGRMLWSGRAYEIGVHGDFFLDTAALGNKIKGGTLSFQARSWYGGWFGWRARIDSGGYGNNEGGATFQQAIFGIELGKRWAKRSGAGYVMHPGLSLLLVPQIGFFNTLIDWDYRSLQLGGSVEASYVLHPRFGINGGFYVGAAIGLGDAWVIGGLHQITVEASTTSDYYPFLQLFYLADAGKLSLGFALGKLKSPIFTLSYRWAGGLGLAGERVGATPLGSTDEDVYASPPSAFASADAQVYRSSASAPSSATTSTVPRPASKPASKPAPAATKPAKALVLRKLEVHDKLGGAAAAKVVRGELSRMLAASRVTLAEDKKVSAVAATLGVGAKADEKQLCALAKALQASHLMSVSIAPAAAAPAKPAAQRVQIAVSLRAVADCSASSTRKTVARSEMLTTLRAMVARTLSLSSR